MKTQRNPNAPCPPAARLAVRSDGLARRGLRGASLAVALVLMASSVASARIENIRWTHNDPSNVAGFVIYYGLNSTDYTTIIDVPPQQPDAQGNFAFDIGVVPDDATVYVAVTAYDAAGVESGYSNEGTRSPAPPEPTPEPTATPTPVPTPESTPVPTPDTTPEPTAAPTPVPTPEPTPQPTAAPTPEPNSPLRTETLRWMHDDPSEVAGFVIHYGLTSGDYTTVFDVPPLQADALGNFSFDIDVPEDATVYVALTAYDYAGQESGYSNEGTRGPDSSEPDPVLGKPGTPYVVTTP